MFVLGQVPGPRRSGIRAKEETDALVGPIPVSRIHTQVCLSTSGAGKIGHAAF